MKNLSIILSCFNGTSLIESYIDAILVKEITDICTLVVVDFPFSHKDPKNVRKQLERYPDLVYVGQKENITVYDAWNLGVAKSKTSFVSNLNLDDRVAADYYKYGTELLIREGADIFSTASMMTDKIGVSDGGRLQMPFTDHQVGNREFIYYDLKDMVYEQNGSIKKRNPPHCCPIWRRSLHDEIGWFDSKKYDFCADYEFWLRAATARKRLIFSPKVKTIFYAAPGTASDRLMHPESKAILERWSTTFPVSGYKQTHLGEEHDKLHHCMNLNAIFSDLKHLLHISNLVSIIVVAHERPDYLGECLRSVRAQSYHAFECIVIIDGDNDELWEVINEVADVDKRFRGIRLGGKVERNYARNVGIALSIGRWVSIIDGDDRLPRDSLFDRVKTARAKQVKVVFGGMRIFSESVVLSENTGPDTFSQHTIKMGWPHHCSLLIERELLKECNYPAAPSDLQSAAHEVAGEDVFFMTNLINRPDVTLFMNCKSIVYEYRRHPSSSYIFRNLSIEKVIGVLRRLHGVPDQSNNDYLISFKTRHAQFIVWSLWSAAQQGSKLDLNAEFLKEAVSIAQGVSIGAVRIILDAFVADVSRTTGFSKEEPSWFYRKLIEVWPDDLEFKPLLNEIQDRIGPVSGTFDALGPDTRQAVLSADSQISLSAPMAEFEELPQEQGKSRTKQGVKWMQPNFSRLLRFKEKHRGEQCILMCNGPSLKEVKFQSINRAEFTIFGLNKIFLGFDLLKVKPDYIVAINKKVIEQAVDEYRETKIVKFLSNRAGVELVPESPVTFYMNTANLPKGASRFSPNVVEYVYEGWTVTHAALQLIFFMGFKKVFIVGMDHRFSQHISGKENQESVIEGDDKDHFHPNYFGNGQTWDLPDLKNSEISYEAARKAFEAEGREIFDCTVGGACVIFSKQDIEVLYG